MPAPSDPATGGSGPRRRALTSIATVLTSQARTSDHVARIGPHRFAVLLPETDEVAAVNFVERVRPQCDEAVGPGVLDERCRFGWADANASRSLDEAAAVAIARLASDI